MRVTRLSGQSGESRNPGGGVREPTHHSLAMKRQSRNHEPLRQRENVARGLVPRWGRGGAWQNPQCQFTVPNHDSGFSYLGLPAPAGISDCDESVSRTTIRDRPLRQPLIRHSRHPFVNPAPHSSFRRRPESRRGGEGQDHHTAGKSPAPHHFHPPMRSSRDHGESRTGRFLRNFLTG